MQPAGKKDKLQKPVLYSELDEYYFNHEEFTTLFNERIKALKDIGGNNLSREKFKLGNDISSHFITRLIAANSNKTSKWFIGREAQLFKYRMTLFKDDFEYKIELPFCSSDLIIDPLYSKNSETKLINLESKFLDVSQRNSSIIETPNKKPKLEGKVKVHFSRISQLLATRSIIPVKGYTPIDDKGRKILLANQFMYDLELKMSKLSLTLKKLPDERLEKLCKSILTEEPVKILEKSSLSIDDKYFPPCISKIIHLMKTHRHLKNNDRQTLSLFLKDINIPINETIDLFRKGFNLSQPDFDKNYLYNIRHVYGLEGKRANYSGFSCLKIGEMRNSQMKSCCPCVDDKDFVKEKYKYDIEEIFKDRNNVTRCTKILEKCTDEKYEENIKSPLQFFVTYKNNPKN